MLGLTKDIQKGVKGETIFREPPYISNSLQWLNGKFGKGKGIIMKPPLPSKFEFIYESNSIS